MAAPLYSQLFPGLVTGGRVPREVDNHYHLQSIADSQRQLVDYHAAVFEQQREAAIATLDAMRDLSDEQMETNSLLSAVLAETNCIRESVLEQTQVLRDGFAIAAKLMIQQRQELQKIAQVLRRPFGTQALELLREAERALYGGMRQLGRAQQEDWNDAIRLVGEVLTNPIGSRNYVAWFYRGWLHWKHTKNVADAEEAFYHATRLSAEKGDVYHVHSLRHLACMQYLQRKFSAAYATIKDAHRAAPNDHDVLYDTARYAAITGRETEAVDLLDNCIERRPSTIVAMFSEEDFVG